MKPALSLILIVIITVLCSGCGSAQGRAVSVPEPEQRSEVALKEEADESNQTLNSNAENEEAETMRMRIGETDVEVVWEDNETVSALKELARDGLRVQMSMYGGFEQVGSLETSLPRSDVQTTTKTGDIVLYSGNQIVVFYGSNSWAYTWLGRIINMSAEDLTKLLAYGNVVITLSLEQVEEK